MVDGVDARVGRVEQTRGEGENKFVWNKGTQQIDGEFERTGGGRLDRRYAELGQTLTVGVWLRAGRRGQAGRERRAQG